MQTTRDLFLQQKLNRQITRKPIEQMELIQAIFTLAEKETGRRPKDFQDYKNNF